MFRFVDVQKLNFKKARGTVGKALPGTGKQVKNAWVGILSKRGIGTILWVAPSGFDHSITTMVWRLRANFFCSRLL
jgi:hypothetical protein